MWERIAVCAFCMVIAAVALAAAGWAVFSGQVGAQGIDALFFLCVCLLAALVFGAIPLSAIRQGLLRDLRKRPAAQQQPERRAAAALSPKPQERAE